MTPGALAAHVRLDTLRLALGLLIVMVMSRIHQLVPGLAVLRPGLVLAIGAAGYAVAHPAAISRENVFRYWWTRFILAIAVQACLSALFGISIGNSVRSILFSFSTVLVLAGLLVFATRTTADLRVFVVAFLVGIAALAWQTNFVFKLSEGDGLARLSELYTFDANDVGLIFVTAVPITIALAAVWRGWRRALLLLLIAAVGVGIARSGSRGAFLALLVCGALMLVLNRGVAVGKRILLAAAVLAALAIAAPPGYFEQMQTIVSPTSDYNWTAPTGRRAVTKRGFGYMLSYPLFGIGINNFQKAECSISDRMQEAAIGVGIRCTAPHNTWVQVGAELGIPGLSIWASMLAVTAFLLFRLSRQLPLSWVAGDPEQKFLFACVSALPISIIGFVVASTFLTFAWLDLPYLLVVLAGSSWMLARRRLMADGQPGRGACRMPAPTRGRRQR